MMIKLTNIEAMLIACGIAIVVLAVIDLIFN